LCDKAILSQGNIATVNHAWFTVADNALFLRSCPRHPHTGKEVGTMHLILSSKLKLQAKYGAGGLAQLESKLADYEATLKDKGVDSASVYVDDPASLSAFNLAPVNAEDAGAIKDLLDALELALQASGQTLDSVLILGGHEIVPFHQLDNPSFSPGGDTDTEVLSDNPYASSDDEYLIPERAVGRLPDGRSNDVSLLLAQLDAAIEHHRRRRRLYFNFGYSAEVWKRASQAVYDTVGKLLFLRLSPPKTMDTFGGWWLHKRSFLYFNLHGSETTPFWYGQGDNSLPIAFGPEMIEEQSADVWGAIAFSEACYGANIVGKDPDEAISLKFMQKGVACFVGSTKISWGPAVPPSSEADLIGVYFMGNVKKGLPFGQALMEAKVAFAQEMIRRYGGLDSDDEKTLLEFVLYGDPCLRR
jgi:hypothetical protein